jgi:hypothetical protein
MLMTTDRANKLIDSSVTAAQARDIASTRYANRVARQGDNHRDRTQSSDTKL